MTPDERLMRIVEDGMCIGCGMCQSVCGSDKVVVRKDREGELRPHIVGPLRDEDVDQVYATCPGTRVEGLPAHELEAAPHHDVVWGAYHRVVLAWAGDEGVRHQGSTGGVLTALGQYLLNSERVAFVLHVKASEQEPTFGVATVSMTADEVLRGAGSRYGPTAVLEDFDSILRRDEPFALIAKPCDLNAVRNLAHSDARVSRCVKYWLAPVCGGYMPTLSTDGFLAERGFSRETIRGLRYRGLGCPGPTTIEALNGERYDTDYLDFWGEDESSWSIPFRCKVCPDGIGEGADIAAADTWPGGSPDRHASKTDPGTNSLIVRTQAGLELLRAAARDGALVLGDDIDVSFLNDTQPHQVAKKMHVGARYEGLSAAGRITPETVSMRLKACAQLADQAELDRQRQGAYERAKKLTRQGP